MAYGRYVAWLTGKVAGKLDERWNMPANNIVGGSR